MVERIKTELRTPKGQLIFFLGLIVLTGVLWLAQGAMITSAAQSQSRKEIREIVLEVRNMTFGDNNPSIYMKPGETVRFTIYNLDPGMRHNFTIENTEVSTRLLTYGEKESVDFTAPQKEEESAYFCIPHASMMSGKLIVSNKVSL